MKQHFSISRRHFLRTSAILSGTLLRCGAGTPSASGQVEEFLTEKMKRDKIPGLAAAIIRPEGLSWHFQHGYADLEKKVPMTIDHDLNIGSISKTFTTTALMQLWETQQFRLEDDVSDYVGFPVRNPSHPDVSISFLDLMTHRSSIRDGIEYGRAYECGDPVLSLKEWIPAYLSPQGELFEASENFHPWAPGERWDYCNVAYGLLAYLTEVISGVPFGRYCHERIFEPLGMKQTSWYLRDIDLSMHALPYTLVEKGVARGPDWGGKPLGIIGLDENIAELADGFYPSCLYNHPNFPDGFLRTSVRQIAHYIQAYLGEGVREGVRLLEKATISEMLREHARGEDRVQGLTWYSKPSEVHETYWGHGGSDPGINTDVRLRFSDGTAAVVFMNTNGVEPVEATEHLMTAASQL